jgi:transposase
MSPRQESAVRTFVFSEQDRDAIHHDRFHHPHPRVQLKMEVLGLKSQGISHTQIARLTRLGRRTVQRYLDEYLEGGLDLVRTVPFHKPQSTLERYADTLEAYFLENPPRSTAEAQAAIERLTGLRRGLTQVRQFLKKRSAWAGVRSA